MSTKTCLTHKGVRPTHVVLTWKKLNHEKYASVDHMYGTITKDGYFTAMNGLKFAPEAAYRVQ